MPTRLEYTVKKILASAKGNRQLAQRSLIETALDDEMLLRELVAPFLKAIASQAIDRELASSSAAPRATVSNIGLGNVARKAVPADLRAGYNPMRAAKNIPQDLGKRQRHNHKEGPIQTQGDAPNHITGRSSNQGSRCNRYRDGPAHRGRTQNSDGIRAQTKKCHMPQRELPHIANN